jgi:hypothetical protein
MPERGADIAQIRLTGPDANRRDGIQSGML